MSRSNINLTEALQDYLRSVGVREDDHLAALRQETAAHPWATMQISQEQGQLMSLLVKLLGARKTLEVGVFTGYSAMVVAQALGPHGRLTALDISDEFTQIARRHWAKAGVAERIDLRLGPAAESLNHLIAAGEGSTFDFSFIDADKASYDTYYELSLQLIRSGGLIAIDNVLWNGAVVDPKNQSDDTVAIRALNRKLHADPRIDLVLVPIGDGLTLARKR